MSDNKIKNFLVNGFQSMDDRKADAREDVEDADFLEESAETCEQPAEPSQDCVPCEGLEDSLRSINDEILKMRYILEDIRQDGQEPKEAPAAPDMSPYLTTREQMRAVTQAVERKDTDSANRNQLRTLEQVAVMREDFFKLCEGIRTRLDKMSAEDVLASFEAYNVDMENILTDGGVFIGQFPYEKLNTLHQRIVDIVPTDDESKNGMIAERLSDGYKIGSKVILKEKVAIYKFTKAAEAAEDETSSETVSEESEEKETENKEETE